MYLLRHFLFFMFQFKNAEQFKQLCGYEIDDFWYPRVTKIVDIKSKPALYFFYAGMENFAAGERVKKNSATEGTLVHEIIEGILTNKKVEIPSSIEPSIKAFNDFLEKKNIQFDQDFIEFRLINHEERYAGTLDAVAMINGKLGILDIKTSQEIYRDYNLQTAAYTAAMKNVLKELETRWILRIDQHRKCVHCGAILRKKGGREKVKINWSNSFMRACRHEWGKVEGEVELKEFPFWEEDYQAFLGAKKLWEWENIDWLKEIGYL